MPRFGASLLILSAVFFFARVAPGEPLIDLGDPVELDRNFNIEGMERFSEAERKPVKVYQYDVPVAQVPDKALAISKFLDSASRDVVLVERGGQKFVRFYVADAPNMNFKEFDAEYAKYRLPKVLEGKKLVSHGTFRVIDASNPKFPRLDIKMSQADGYNPAYELASAIRSNDEIELVMRDADRNTKLVSFMPERFSASLPNGKSSYAYSLRLHEASGNPDTEIVQTLPLHGLLGNEALLAKLAERRGVTRDEWMLKEYLPQLARFHAQLNFRHGVYLQGHTQNTLLRINRKTGSVEGVVGRDISDLMYAPYHRAVQKGKTIVFENNGDEIYQHFQRRGLEQPEGHTEQYVRQAVNAAFGTVGNYDEGGERKANGRRVFLKTYLDEAERVTSQQIPRTTELEYAIGELADLGLGIGQIHKLLAEARLPKFTAGMTPKNQAELAAVFSKRSKEGGVSMVLPDSRQYLEHLGPESLIYATDGRGIYQLEKSGLKPLAYAHSLASADRKVLSSPRVCRFGELSGHGL